jgi:hypothetical protein
MSIRVYTLHQVLSLLFVERAIVKVSRRSKRAYTLLDLPCWVLISLGSKRTYTPRERVDITYYKKTP